MLKNNETVVAIIIARGGSKSISRKNVLPLKRKPLVAWPIDLARSVERIDRIIISSDDNEILKIARQHGAEVLFTRPAELARDETPTVPVLQHCVHYLEKMEKYMPDIIALLYPTSPFLKQARVNEALDLFESTDCNSVVSVVEDVGHYWTGGAKPKRLYPVEIVNRQQAHPLYREDGAIYFNRRNVIMEQGKILDEERVEFLVMNEDKNIDIDEPADFKKAEKFLKH